MTPNFSIENLKGLSEQEALVLLAKEGFNELPTDKKPSFLGAVIQVLKEPMLLILLACAALYLFLGDPKEALILSFFVVVIIVITIVQEHKTEQALAALSDLSSPHALVLRDQKPKRIPSKEVVPGDILILSEGDRVAADAKLLEILNFFTDESLLTGESAAVSKTIWKQNMSDIPRPGGDGLPFVYSGTLVVKGKAMAQVVATGANTQIGKIGKMLGSLEQEVPLLKKEVNQVVGIMATLGLGLCVLVVIFFALTRGSWLGGFLSGLSLAMSMMPEELPVVLTIFMALGAWRISQKGVLARRIAVLESLGSATVLCVDKTGTITQNKMSIALFCANQKKFNFKEHPQNLKELPEDFHEIAEFSILASQNDPFDPMEIALKKVGQDTLIKTEHLHSDWKLVRQYPLSSELLALSHVWESGDGQDLVIAAKGAPEAIFDLCHLEKDQIIQLEKQVRQMADTGFRVLGVAKSKFQRKNLPDIQHDFTFNFLGLVAFEDPIRPNVPAAIKECYQAGIRVIMITGDGPDTAKNIAKQINLSSPENFLIGADLDNLSDDALKEKLDHVNVFARVIPEEKLRLVNILKNKGHVVAMTGDGVNDAPALKSAHIGIAMGARGTDVARQAASLVLVEDDFSSIVEAVKMGRRIFDNLKRCAVYILAIHIPIAGLAAIPVFFNWPLVLFPTHIAFLEIIIDPICSVAFEAEPQAWDTMKKKPRHLSQRLLDKNTMWFGIFQGLSVLMASLAIYFLALHWNFGEASIRTMCFITLIFGNVGLALTNRSWSESILGIFNSPNKAMKWIVLGAILILALLLEVPFLRDLFKFQVLSFKEIALCSAVGLASILWFEFLKKRLHFFPRGVQ